MRTRMVAVFLAGVVPPVYAYHALGEPERATGDGYIVATYDGGEVTASELRRESERAGDVGRIDPTSSAPAENRTGDLEALAKEVAVREILLAEAHQRQLGQSVDDHLDQKLLEQKVLAECLSARIERECRQLPVGDQQVSLMLEECGARFMPVQSVSARRIVIDRETSDVVSARRRAERALAELRGGASFLDVAKEYSDAPDAARTSATYTPGFWDGGSWPIIRQTGKGEVTPVLSTARGFEIVAVDAFVVAPQATEADAREAAVAEIRQSEFETRLTALLGAAGERFPIRCEDGHASLAIAAPATTQPAEQTAIRCGGFHLTAAEARILAERMGWQALPCGRVAELLDQRYGESLLLGEMARSEKLDRDAACRKALDDARENDLCRRAKETLIAEWSSMDTFDGRRDFKVALLQKHHFKPMPEAFDQIEKR